MSRMHHLFDRRHFAERALNAMAELSLAERGAYYGLIDLLISRDAVPDNDVLVARMLRCHWREWRAIKRRLIDQDKVRVVGGRLMASLLEPFLPAVWDRQDALKNGSRTRHDSKKPREINDALVVSASAPPKSRGVQRRRRTALPDDWVPDDRARKHAADRGFTPSQIEEMASAFANYHRARGNLMVDWCAAWRTWVANEIKFSRNNGAGDGKTRQSGGGIFELDAALDRALSTDDRTDFGLRPTAKIVSG